MSMFYELMMKKKGMPSRYQEVEYIESTGTQWIDTGYKAKTNTIFEVDCAFTDLSEGRNGYLQNTGGNVYRYYFGVLNSKFIGANNTTYNHSIQDADTQRHIFAIKQDGIYIDNTKVYSSNALYGSINIYLFVTNVPDAVGGKNYYCKQKVYNSKIYDNNRLVRNYIPVYDTLTQKYGMWETVQGKFYGNDGTGDFKGSIVGYTIVGSPTITDGVVSGFSASDYLQTSSLFEETTDNFETVVKFNVFSYAGTNTYKGLVGTGGIGWFLGLHQQYNKFVVYVSSTGTNWNIAIDKRGTYNIPINTDIYVKILKNSTSFKVLYSLNGSSWIEDINIDMTSALKSGTNRNIRFGGAVAGTTTYIDGSIDIANSYIKINNKLWFNGQQA